MTTALVTMDEMSKMATAMVKSRLFGFDTPDQAMSIMLIAQAEGRHPALAARDYHVIQGRPALKADAMLARFQQEGGIVEWDEYTDEKVCGRFSHPTSCPKPVAISWTMDMARRIGLGNKDNWKKYPRAMLRARVISEGVRTTFPGIAVGVYTVEEVRDLEEKDITPNKATAGVLGTLPIKTQEAIVETAMEVKALLANDQTMDAYALWQNSKFDADETVAFWSLFDSKQRGTLGRLGESEKAAEKGVISPAQKKRLEARIGELKLDRDKIKKMCVDEFGKEHFSDLTQEEYNIVDQNIDYLSKSAPSQQATSSPVVPGHPAAGADTTTTDAGNVPITDEETDSGVVAQTNSSASTHAQINEALSFASKAVTARFDLLLKGRKIEDLDEAAAIKALGWLNSEIDK